MAGVSETSAITALTIAAGKLSYTIYRTADEYKQSKDRIGTLGKEVEILSGILKQVDNVFGNSLANCWKGSDSVNGVLADIVEQCHSLFSQLEAYIESIHASKKGQRPM